MFYLVTGYSTTGEVFNLRAEEVATKTSTYLKADKLIFLGEQQGLPNEDGQLLRELSPHQLDYYIQQYQTTHPTLTLHLQEAKSIFIGCTSCPSNFLFL